MKLLLRPWPGRAPPQAEQLGLGPEQSWGCDLPYLHVRSLSYTEDGPGKAKETEVGWGRAWGGEGLWLGWGGVGGHSVALVGWGLQEIKA